jgi:pSer/pThr/pTyr-binding forkhead associated (FHA) protein
VEDLGSRNGTFVNGEAVHGPVQLTPGDQLQVGVTLVELRSATQVAERPSAVHQVPPPLAVPPRTPDYLAGTDPGETPAPAPAPDPDPVAPDLVAVGPGGRPRHELDPLLDSRTKGKARTAPLALFVLVALVVIIYLATSR